MSIQGLAAFGLAFTDAYQKRGEHNKKEAERLADKEYQRGREKVQDDRAAQTFDMQKAAEGREVQKFGVQQEASQMQLDAAKLQTQIEGGLRKATTAYSAGDKSGAFAAFEETGNSLYPNMQMKFDRDEKGNIIVDPTTGAASGQRFTATGTPVGQKISMKPEQAHQTLYAAMNPAKYVENQAAAAAEVAKAEREWNGKILEAGLGLVTHSGKAAIDNGFKLGQMGVQHTQNMERDAAKPATGSAAKAQFAPVSAAQSSLPSSLIRTESGGNFGASNNVRGHGGAIGHFGRAQFGQARLREAAAAGVIPKDMTPAQFMASPEAQAATEQWHQNDILNFINKNGFEGKVGTQVKGVPVTLSGLVAVAHLGGKGGMQKFIQSNGRYDPADANGTRLSDYLRIHGQADIAGRMSGIASDANQITKNIGLMTEQLVADLKGSGEGEISPIVIKQSLTSAGRSLEKVLQNQKPAERSKHFNDATTHIRMMLNGRGITNPSEEMIGGIAANLMGFQSYQAMAQNLFANSPAPTAKTQPNPFEGGSGIPSSTALPKTSQALAAHAQAQPVPATNLYPATANLTAEQRAAVTKNMFTIGSDQ